MEYKRREDVSTFHAPGSERLERLAAFLDELPEGSLTFCYWYDRGRGCAVGLAAALDPWFKAQGLRLDGVGDLKDCRPVYRDRSDWQAVTAFFALSDEEAHDLFDRGGYGGDVRPHPREVARKVRAFLKSAELAVPA